MEEDNSSEILIVQIYVRFSPYNTMNYVLIAVIAF
jgi:hypothetical protein